MRTVAVALLLIMGSSCSPAVRARPNVNAGADLGTAALNAIFAFRTGELRDSASLNACSPALAALGSRNIAERLDPRFRALVIRAAGPCDDDARRPGGRAQWLVENIEREGDSATVVVRAASGSGSYRTEAYRLAPVYTGPTVSRWYVHGVRLYGFVHI
jgi:hypothetical protein